MKILGPVKWHEVDSMLYDSRLPATISGIDKKERERRKKGRDRSRSVLSTSGDGPWNSSPMRSGSIPSLGLMRVAQLRPVAPAPAQDIGTGISLLFILQIPTLR